MKNLKLMKEEFIALLKETGREGVDYVIEDLEDLGFFEAPASSAFHLNRDGGLVEHSLNVCKVALKLRESMVDMDGSLAMELPKDSVIIASLDSSNQKIACIEDNLGILNLSIQKELLKTQKELLKINQGHAELQKQTKTYAILLAVLILLIFALLIYSMLQIVLVLLH